MIIDLGLFERVRWTGREEDAEVSADLSACDLLFLPYLDGASLRRGTLMAGLAHGCAIVTTTPQSPLSVSVNQVPLAGGLSIFEARVHNRGPVDLDILTARDNGGQIGDVSVSVKNAAGQEVSRTEFKGVPPGSFFLPDGRVRFRIRSGGSAAFTIPNVLVPEALGSQGTATFEILISKIYYSLAHIVNPDE